MCIQIVKYYLFILIDLIRCGKFFTRSNILCGIALVDLLLIL